jgi:putative endonuclease
MYVMSYYVYVLMNPDNKIYIGQTNDLQRRLEEHNDPDFRGTLYTKRNKGPWELVYSEEYATRSEAMIRERQLKSFQGREFIRKHLQEGDGC